MPLEHKPFVLFSVLSKIDFMTLKVDQNQQKAIEHYQGPALVVAGPGSGKTTVIKERILNLIQSHNVNPEQILAIAFTNAAAEEMDKRFLSEPTLKDSKPEICTLHVFGKDIITEHYELAGFTQEPDIWDSNDIEQIINKEKTRLNIENEERFVYIYKFEGNRSGRCYIGQTIDLERREREHRTYSSNRGLREALATGDEYFNCKEIKRVKGLYADKEEEQQINLYKDRSVVNLALGMEHIGIKHPEIPITIYKIKLSTVVTSWIGMSTDIDPEIIKNEAFRRAIEAKGTKAHPEYIKEALRKQLKNLNNTLLEELIPVLDTFESQFSSLSATAESNDIPADLVPLTESFRHPHVQLLNSLKNHGLEPIGTSRGAIFNPVHHEEIQPATYSDDIPTGKVIREEKHGYLLHGQVIRKAQVVISKRKQQADVYLSRNFEQPVRFITYTDMHDLKDIEVHKDGIIGFDSENKRIQLQNLKVLFAFPKEDMKALKPCIKKWLVIANRNLQPITLTSERFHVAEEMLNQLLIDQDAITLDIQNPTVQVRTRSGHVLQGHLSDFDENFLYMKINNKNVIVYRSGILKFINLTWNEITKAYKNDTPINGHIIERINSGFRVKFKSLTGFLPASQVEIKTVRNLDLYVGKTLKMMVIKLNKSNNSIVFSRRALLEEERTKLFNAFRKIPEEPLTVRNIERRSKTTGPIPETNVSTLFPKAKRILLNKSISVIVPEPVEEMIDTPLPMSTDLMESLDTYTKNLKPEPPPIEIDPDLLETINSEADPTLRGYEDILTEQIQNLRPDTFEPDIASQPPIAPNNMTQETPHPDKDILKEQIQDLRPDIYEPENRNNVTQQPTSETGVDRETSVKSTTLTRSDSSTEIDNDSSQTAGQISEENKVEDTKKSIGYYLRRGGRFAVEKIKSTFSKKPNS